MKHSIEEKTAALAGIFQAAQLVDKLATKGQFAPAPYEVLIASLFKFDADDVKTIYDGQIDDNHGYASQRTSQSLSTGIRVVKDVLADNQSVQYANTIRYVLALIQLEKNLLKRSDVLAKIQSAMKDLSPKLESYESLLDNELTSELSKIYVDTIGTLSFRIQVNGKMQHLQNKENEAKVRSLLFAGIRSAMLWRQLGGRRWHLLVLKGSIVRSLEHLKSS